MKSMTPELRNKIAMYIKNKIDISDLIKDADLRNEDLSGAIIKTFNRVKLDCSGCNFSNAVIGEEGKITNLSKSKFRNCKFVRTKFIGKVWLRHCDLRGSLFTHADCSEVEWQYSDGRDCDFCETLLRLGVGYFYKAKVDLNLFKDFTKHMNIEVKFKEPPTDEELEKTLEE